MLTNQSQNILLFVTSVCHRYNKTEIFLLHFFWQPWSSNIFVFMLHQLIILVYLLFRSHFCTSNQHFNLRNVQILIQDIKNVCLPASCSHLCHVVRTQHVSPNSQTVSLLLEYKRNDSVNAKTKNPKHIQSAVVWPFPLDKKGVSRWIWLTVIIIKTQR